MSADGLAVWLLAIGQTLIYAGAYYAFPALLPDLEAATGWTKAQLAFGPTLGFLIMAVLTPFTGRLVDRGLGGEMLILLPALAAVGVAALGFASSLWAWWLAWALIGVALSGCLYETCFAFLTRRLADARGAITRVTLVAGFAGTLAFPLGHWLGARYGGPRAMVAFGCLVATAVAVNAVAVTLLRRGQRARGPTMPVPPGALRTAMRQPGFWGISAVFGLIWLNHGILVTYVLTLFADRGAVPAVAALAAASIGPSQVLGRLVLLMAGARVGNGAATRVALALVVLAAGLLWSAGASLSLIFAFAAAQGAGAGLLSILRPVLVADVLGRQGFGVISGAIAVAPILASAAAPVVGAALLGLGGPTLVYAACFAMAAAGLGIGLLLVAGRT